MEIQQKSKMRGSFEQQQEAASDTPSLYPSPSSSPSHEFSFTISFDSSLTQIHDRAKSHQPPSAVDLTPADDIFFHGHLLPLHVLSNLPVSPRSSTNSLDSFTLPIKELLGDEDKPHHNIDICVCSNCDKSKHHSFNSYEYRRNHDHENNSNNNSSSSNINNNNNDDDDELPTKKRVKSKSFSFFGLPRRRKDEDSSEKQKRKVKFDVGHFLKKYIRMFSKGSKDDIQLRKQPYSFSGKLSSREARMNLRGIRRREFSAPASIRTSPTNSGIIKAAPGAKPHPHPSNDSTMEELQAAIQAAIAHCKNSIATHLVESSPIPHEIPSARAVSARALQREASQSCLCSWYFACLILFISVSGGIKSVGPWNIYNRVELVDKTAMATPKMIKKGFTTLLELEKVMQEMRDQRCCSDSSPMLMFTDGLKRPECALAEVIVAVQISSPLLLSGLDEHFIPPAKAVLYSPDTKAPRIGELALRRDIPCHICLLLYPSVCFLFLLPI